MSAPANIDIEFFAELEGTIELFLMIKSREIDVTSVEEPEIYTLKSCRSVTKRGLIHK